MNRECVPRVWELGQQGAGKQKGHEIRMEVEAEGLFGLWASVEYLRMPGRGDDSRGGGEPGRKAREMSIRPTKFEVNNDNGMEVDICIDPESEGIVYFILDQDNKEIIVSIDCLRGLLLAAEQLLTLRKRGRND